MPLYTHNGEQGEPLTIPELLERALKKEKGPQPWLNANDKKKYLFEGDTGVQKIGEGNSRTSAFNLINCAAVIYQSCKEGSNDRAYVHHARSGAVYQSDVQDAIEALGKPPASTILVVYAHPGDSENGYTSAIETIIGQGIKAEHVIQLPNLIGITFGINNLGQVG